MWWSFIIRHFVITLLELRIAYVCTLNDSNLDTPFFIYISTLYPFRQLRAHYLVDEGRGGKKFRFNAIARLMDMFLNCLTGTMFIHAQQDRVD